MNTSKLSQLQKRILYVIGYGVLGEEPARGSRIQPDESALEWAHLKHLLSLDYSPWASDRTRKPSSPTLSRAIRRLIARGLIEVRRETLVRVEREQARVILYTNGTVGYTHRLPAVYRATEGKRISHVGLTPAGREVAKEMRREATHGWKWPSAKSARRNAPEMARRYGQRPPRT